MAIEGVDYAWDRANPAGLAAAGKKFAFRYGGPGSAGKQLDPAEARALAAAGLFIVANAEGAADGMLGGFAAGADWARSAEAHFRNCGMPTTQPIYLSADFDVQASQWPTVAAALDGAASVLGAARVGLYGGYNAIAWAVRDGKARWWWQTYAWSGGRWHPAAHVQQYKNHVALAGGTVDLNRAMVADYGQWTPGREDMSAAAESQIANIYAAIFYGGPSCGTTVAPANGRDPSNSIVNKLDWLIEKSAEGEPSPPADLAAIKAVLLDPEVLTAQAEAVANEEAARLAE